jgi:hypothetical protein
VGRRSSRCRTASLSAALILAPTLARADRLVSEPLSAADRGYSPIEELSYEALVEPGAGYDALLRLRLALHNASGSPRDAVVTLALPRTAELVGFRTARDGTWTDGVVTGQAGEAARRDPGTAWARMLPPIDANGLPGAEIVVVRLEPSATLQVELAVRVLPRLTLERLVLDLPERGHELEGLARARRILVRGVKEFWVDDASNAGAPVLLARSNSTATVAWPAPAGPRRALEGHVEAMPDDFGGSELRLLLRLGSAPALRPDHVTVVVDRSRSTRPETHCRAAGLLGDLAAALPATTTFDVMTFARTPRVLVSGARLPDATARETVRQELCHDAREQGSDVSAALATAAELSARARARHPAILVITDGMLPSTLPPGEVRAAVEGPRRTAKRRRTPEVVFVVDEPLWADRGIPADHPVARIAAELGARIGHKALERLPGDHVIELLAAPRVLGDLRITVPAGVHLHEQPPRGLVAGNALVLVGDSRRAHPGPIRVEGRLGARRVQERIEAHQRRLPPQALVAAVAGADIAASAKEGFALPTWYGDGDRRLAEVDLAQAGRGGAPSRGTLTPEIVRRYLRIRVLPRARACYRTAIARDRQQRGRVVMQLELGKGEIMYVRPQVTTLAVPDPSLVDCLVQAAWQLDIPAAELDDRTYVVHYPIQLVPPEGATARPTEDVLGPETLDLLLREAH